MIEIKCKLDKAKDNEKRTANGYCKVSGTREDVIIELRIIFMQLEKSTDEATFADALDDWLRIEKGFKG